MRSEPSLPPTVSSSRRTFFLIVLLSVAIPLAVAILLLAPQTRNFVPGADGPIPRAATLIPPLNALLNSLTAVALLVGYACIRGGRVRAHRAAMLTAFTLSSMFLILYVIYHAFPQTREAHYGGTGWVRYVYFGVLISHIVLATIIVPLVLTALYLALTGQYARHRKVTRWTFPIWVYVSVTGVIAYFMIAPYYPWNHHG